MPLSIVARFARPSAWRPVLACLVLVAVLAGCRAEVEIAVQLQENGSGVVRVGVGLDADALGRSPELANQVQLEDLRQAGWTIDGPAAEGDGFTWWRLSKPFAEPGEAAAVLAEVGGADGPLADLRLTVARHFARSTYGATGSVDFTGGLEQFGDSELAAALDGEPLGVDQAELELQLGAPVDDLVAVRLRVELPGEDPVTVEPRLAGPAVPVAASVTAWRPASLIATAVAALAVAGALVFLLVQLSRARSRAEAGRPA